MLFEPSLTYYSGDLIRSRAHRDFLDRFGAILQFKIRMDRVEALLLHAARAFKNKCKLESSLS